jgi:hypothetical protein
MKPQVIGSGGSLTSKRSLSWAKAQNSRPHVEAQDHGGRWSVAAGGVRVSVREQPNAVAASDQA